MYKPSSELQRQVEENLNNEQRMEQYKAKKEDLDVTEEWRYVDADYEYIAEQDK